MSVQTRYGFNKFEELLTKVTHDIIVDSASMHSLMEALYAQSLLGQRDVRTAVFPEEATIFIDNHAGERLIFISKNEIRGNKTGIKLEKDTEYFLGRAASEPKDYLCLCITSDGSYEARKISEVSTENPRLPLHFHAKRIDENIEITRFVVPPINTSYTIPAKDIEVTCPHCREDDVPVQMESARGNIWL